MNDPTTGDEPADTQQEQSQEQPTQANEPIGLGGPATEPLPGTTPTPPQGQWISKEEYNRLRGAEQVIAKGRDISALLAFQIILAILAAYMIFAFSSDSLTGYPAYLIAIPVLIFVIDVLLSVRGYRRARADIVKPRLNVLSFVIYLVIFGVVAYPIFLGISFAIFIFLMSTGQIRGS